MASAISAVPRRRVCQPEMAPICWMSSALPAAADAVLSMMTSRATASRAASACATAPPSSPAPMMATVVTRGILVDCYRQYAPGLREAREGPAYESLASMSLTGKTAFVTGGSRGIGLAIARALLQEGANVALTATTEPSASGAADALGAKFSRDRVLGLAANVRDLAAVERAITATSSRFGGLDILINNAGVGRLAPFDQLTPEIWNEVIGTNLTGVFNCCHAAIPRMRGR